MFVHPLVSRRVAILANLLEILFIPTHAAALNGIIAVWKRGFLSEVLYIETETK
jgi:hypothetical protein